MNDGELDKEMGASDHRPSIRAAIVSPPLDRGYKGCAIGAGLHIPGHIQPDFNPATRADNQTRNKG